jgi:SPP1 gp7 family putative phage head morphogenesis protein
MIPSRLEAVAHRLEREGLRQEAAAVRAVNAAYRTMDLADLIALTRQVSDNPVSARRVAEVDRLMTAFDAASVSLQAPPEQLAAVLQQAVRASVSAAEAMLESAGSALEAFRVAPLRELEFTRHAAERLQRYWGVETVRFRNEVQSVLLEGLERGQGIPQLSASLRERVAVSRSRARLIVRNETGNASAHAQRESQLEAGITHYFWLTANDGRVRPEHRARNGRRYAWDDPPADGHPGQPVQCRCVSVPDLSQ